MSKTFARSCLVVTSTAGATPSPSRSPPAYSQVHRGHGQPAEPPRGWANAVRGITPLLGHGPRPGSQGSTGHQPGWYAGQLATEARTKKCLHHIQRQGGLVKQLEQRTISPLSFPQKAGVGGATWLLPEKFKTIGSKELGSQLQGTRRTRSWTCWTSTRCLQVKLQRSFEKN